MLAIEKGQLLESKTGTFSDKKTGEPIHFGRVQVMSKDDQGFYKIRNLKVKRENFALLEDAQKLRGKPVEVECEVQEFGKDTTFYAVAVRAA